MIIDIGKRSIKTDKHLPNKNVIGSDINPIPFDILEHGPRLRSRRQTEACGDSETQHVLFVVDTSGSIGEENFKNITASLGKLVPLFCKQVRFAFVTFSSHVHLEFCFDNTYHGREQVKNAIENVPYHGGRTHTGGMARCICEEIVQTWCGLKKVPPDCLEVVFITDGKSD